MNISSIPTTATSVPNIAVPQAISNDIQEVLEMSKITQIEDDLKRIKKEQDEMEAILKQIQIQESANNFQNEKKKPRLEFVQTAFGTSCLESKRELGKDSRLNFAPTAFGKSSEDSLEIKLQNKQSHIDNLMNLLAQKDKTIEELRQLLRQFVDLAKEAANNC